MYLTIIIKISWKLGKGGLPETLYQPKVLFLTAAFILNFRFLLLWNQFFGIFLFITFNTPIFIDSSHVRHVGYGLKIILYLHFCICWLITYHIEYWKEDNRQPMWIPYPFSPLPIAVHFLLILTFPYPQSPLSLSQNCSGDYLMWSSTKTCLDKCVISYSTVKFTRFIG